MRRFAIELSGEWRARRLPQNVDGYASCGGKFAWKATAAGRCVLWVCDGQVPEKGQVWGGVGKRVWGVGPMRSPEIRVQQGGGAPRGDDWWGVRWGSTAKVARGLV